MKRILFAGILLVTFQVALIVPVQAQLFIDDFNPITIDFNSFDGSGFCPIGGSGTLDSNIWKTLGLSDGSMDFGDTKTDDDFARGLSTGGITLGGFYAWDVKGDYSVIAAGWQPSSSDTTPGNLVLWLQNNTGVTLQGLDISFETWVNNDGGFSSALNFGFQTTNPPSENDTGTLMGWYNTPAAADTLGFQSSSSGTINISQTLYDSDGIYLIWSTNDVSGLGSRDELGISNIIITPIAPVPVPTTILLLGSGLISLVGIRRKFRS
jgi:PEP-CTERM motif